MAIQSNINNLILDCFALLAMTVMPEDGLACPQLKLIKESPSH